MAVWQFNVFLVPTTGVEDIRSSQAVRVSDMEALPALPREHHDRFIDRLQKILPLSASHSLEDYFGREDSITVRREKVSWSLLLRIDLRHYEAQNREDLSEVLQLAQEFELVALLDDMTVVLPQLDIIEHAARESRAMKYVQDPQAFFRK